jgi:hypothetical protein
LLMLKARKAPALLSGWMWPAAGPLKWAALGSQIIANKPHEPTVLRASNTPLVHECVVPFVYTEMVEIAGSQFAHTKSTMA